MNDDLKHAIRKIERFLADFPRSVILEELHYIIHHVRAADEPCPKCEKWAELHKLQAGALLRRDKQLEMWERAWDELLRMLKQRESNYAEHKDCVQAVCVLAAATNSMKALDPRRKAEPKPSKFTSKDWLWG